MDLFQWPVEFANVVKAFLEAWACPERAKPE